MPKIAAPPQELGRLFSARTMLLGHGRQIGVEFFERNTGFFQKRDDIGGGIGEHSRQTIGNIRLGCRAALAVLTLGTGQVVPAGRRIGRFAQPDQRQLPGDRAGREGVEQQRLTLQKSGGDGGIHRRPRAGTKIDIGAVQLIGLQLGAVHAFAGPARGAVEEAPLFRLLGIAKQRHHTRLGQLRNIMEIGRRGALALHDIVGHIPAFGGAGERMADGADPALFGRMFPDIAAPDPLLGEDLHVIVGDGLFQGDGVARNGFGAAAIAAFQHLTQQGGDEIAALPVQACEDHSFARAAPFCLRGLTDQQKQQENGPPHGVQPYTRFPKKPGNP